MIAQNLHRLKVEKSDQCLTSYAGLPLLSELAHQTGLVEQLDAIPGLWQRQGSYRTSDYIMSLAMTLIAGGEGLDDTRLLRCDPGLNQLTFPTMPAANTFGEFLRRFGHRSLHHLSRVVSGLGVSNIVGNGPLTLDIDSSLIESNKEEAAKTYKGFDGYNPLLAWLAEPNVFLGGVFRAGNASPQSHLKSLLKYCRAQLPKNIPLNLRSDSAGYRLDLIDYCQRNGVRFTITADLDSAVRETIEAIPEKHWRLVVRGEDTFLLAETIHVPGGAGDNAYKLPAYRLIVTKRLTGQLELFKDPIKHHAILSDFDESWPTERLLDHHNARGTAEKALAELKNGFGLDKLPCKDLFANAAFFQTVMLAYNLVQTFKRHALPEGWRTFCIKNLRFRLLCQAAIVVTHARRLVMKLSAAFPFFEVFEQARWAVMNPAIAPACG
jgi:hypothetical protein